MSVCTCIQNNWSCFVEVIASAAHSDGSISCTVLSSIASVTLVSCAMLSWILSMLELDAGESCKPDMWHAPPFCAPVAGVANIDHCAQLHSSTVRVAVFLIPFPLVSGFCCLDMVLLGMVLGRTLRLRFKSGRMVACAVGTE